AYSPKCCSRSRHLRTSRIARWPSNGSGDNSPRPPVRFGSSSPPDGCGRDDTDFGRWPGGRQSHRLGVGTVAVVATPVMNACRIIRPHCADTYPWNVPAMFTFRAITPYDVLVLSIHG